MKTLIMHKYKFIYIYMHGRRLSTTQTIICLYSEKTKLLSDIEKWCIKQDLNFKSLKVGSDLNIKNKSIREECMGVTLGGDGTFLEGIRVFGPKEIPMLGINQGTLSFLARISPENAIDAIQEAINGRSKIASRQQVSVLNDNLDAMGVNDIMIEPIPPEKPVDRKIASLNVYVNNEYVGKYTGSGIAISTPTGSTGVSLSAGGPIHHPSNNQSLQIIPLQTHNAGVRPLIVDESAIITIKPEDNVSISVDGGRHYKNTTDKETITVTGSDISAHIIKSKYESPFFNALSEKLGWGIRNNNNNKKFSKESENSNELLTKAKNIAIEALKSAGEPLREIHGEVENIHYKKDKSDIVTEGDYRSEKIITQTIRNEFPSHSIISEEKFTYKIDESEYMWILDPLDGTGNFSHGNPNYSISLALTKNNEILVGVVYAPETDECYFAIKDKGAWLNGKKLTVTKRKSLKKSMLISGYDPQANFIRKLYDKTQGVRAIGSTSLNLCYVASGSADGSWEFDTYPWDIAAGLLIVRESGGKITDKNGNKFSFDINNKNEIKSLLATNSLIHKQILNNI